MHKELRKEKEKRIEVEHQLNQLRGQLKVTSQQVKIRGRQEFLEKQQAQRIAREKENLQRSLAKVVGEIIMTTARTYFVSSLIHFLKKRISILGKA